MGFKAGVGVFKDRLLVPKYDNPAALGGSFVVNCATRVDASTSGQHPIIKQEQIDAYVSERKPRAERSDLRASMKNLCNMLFDMIAESLASDDPEVWETFWSSNMNDYIGMVRAISVLRTKLDRGAVPIAEETISAALSSRYSTQAATLREAVAMVGFATKQALNFGPVPAKFEPQDIELSTRFRIGGGFYSACMLTLELAANDFVSIPEPLLKCVFAMLLLNVQRVESAMVEGARLRRQAAFDQLESDLQNILCEVRTQVITEIPEDMRVLAKEASTPSDELENVDDWARRLSAELAQRRIKAPLRVSEAEAQSRVRERAQVRAVR